ncbi:MAG: hypothetical protein D6705_17510 [Deltaproteobacteria bacterium]|nr:MAG: hypothetical protein D6705_17510 [Deltaproteobacteria bacterium]
MIRHPFSGHRRYSITHRAVQRLRELVPGRTTASDEALRDEIDEAIARAERADKAIRTLDAMLGEPQTLVPIDDYGERFYAIIKEETVVTILPRAHGEDILQRGQAMEQRVAERGLSPHDVAPIPPKARHKEGRTGPVVVERIVRGAGRGGGIVSRIERVGSMEPERDVRTATTDVAAGLRGSVARVVTMGEGATPDSPAATLLDGAIRKARRRAALLALREVLEDQPRNAPFAPIWREMEAADVTDLLTCGDILDAGRVRR